MSETKMILRSSCQLPLNERFTKVLQDLNTRTRTGTRRSRVQLQNQVQRRPSVWLRLGWRRSLAPRGFWSFRQKYRWRARCSAAYRRRRWQRLKQWGGARRVRGRSLRSVLDSELDDYMSLSRRRLDQQLDDYMSMSKSQLDRELDDYMATAGHDTQWC